MSATFEKHLEYRDYNKVVVTLITQDDKGSPLEFVISNANTKGISLVTDPRVVSRANLVSLNIEPPAFDSGDPNNCGAKGSITIVDYKDDVFNILINHFINFLIYNKKLTAGDDLSKATAFTKDDQIKNSELLPKIKIEINCYIGPKKTYEGHILDWSTQFVGTTPNIQLNWSVVVPTDPPSKVEEPKHGIDAPAEYIEDLKNIYYKDQDYKPKHINILGKPDAWDQLVVTKPADESGAQQSSSGNCLVDALYYICANSVAKTSDGDKPVIGYLSDNCEDFNIVIKDPKNESNNQQSNNISNSVIFVQNGKWAAYSSYQGKTVIPMTSFSFDTSFNKLAIQFSIIENPNGNKTTVNGNQSTTGSEQDGKSDTSQTQAQVQSLSKDNGQGAINIKFDCYNIMALDQYNLASSIEYLVFNELGVKHVTSGRAIVTKVSYELQGAVVKASVEATQVFNSVIPSINDDNSTKNTIGNLQTQDKSLPLPNVATGNSSNPDNPPVKSGDQQKSSKNMNLVEYLCTEDEDPIPLNVDKTNQCLQSGLFDTHVITFLHKYGDLTGTSKLLDADFIQTLMDDGNFGLLALLIGAGNYGIKNYEAYTTGDHAWASIDDAVNKYNELNKTKFCASSGGKNPYDYKTGGLGMPHWDAENLKDIYTRLGFDENISDSDRKHFESLLLDIPKKNSEKYTGKITGWQTGKLKLYYKKTGLDLGITRCFPVFSGTVYMRRFDNGLKQDTKWLDWAKQILYYQGESGNDRYYQLYLFQRWIDKFWLPAIKGLSNAKAESGHTICLQDAIRISRAGSSATGLMSQMYGKNVKHQYEIYYGGKDRYDRQKAFCRRIADIIGYELSDD